MFCVPEGCNAACAATAREAARILAQIVEKMTINGQRGPNVTFSFDAPLPLHDRLCVWGAHLEDREDDTPREDLFDRETCLD